MTNALNLAISCEYLGLEENFPSKLFWSCFFQGMLMEQINENVCRNIKYVFIKFAQTNMQKCITWPKKPKNCSQEWDKACVEGDLHLRKLNTLVKTRYCSIFILDIFSNFATNVFVIIFVSSKIIMFQDALQF
jgi:hypothetical protein